MFEDRSSVVVESACSLFCAVCCLSKSCNLPLTRKTFRGDDVDNIKDWSVQVGIRKVELYHRILAEGRDGQIET